MKNELLEKISKGYKNLIVEGQLSSGKTTNVLFPIVDDIISKKESLVLLDSKEEYLNVYYKKLKNNGYKVNIINLRDASRSEGWNPLEYPYDLFKSNKLDYAQEQIEKIGKTIFFDKNAIDPFWTESAKDFFTGNTLGLFEDGTREEINFSSINNMFNCVGKQHMFKDIAKYYFEDKGVNSKPYIFASSTVFSPRETQGGILATARQKLRLYISRDNLSKLLSKTTFDIKGITKEPTAIIIIGRDDSSYYINQIVSLFINQLYSILVEEKVNNQIHIILDNFDYLENYEGLTEMLGSCISRNIKTYIATRSLADLQVKYGSSINYLCDFVKINNNDINITINNEEDTLVKAFEKVIIIKDESIDYPKLNVDEVKVFDMEKFVIDKHPFKPENNPSKANDPTNPFLFSDDKTKLNSINYDSLIKKIDDKIVELEKEEKERKSDFEDFKF